MSRSAATSLMVRNASGALSKCPLLFRLTRLQELYSARTHLGQRSARHEGLIFGAAVAVGRAVAVDPLLQDRGRLEHHHPARRNRHFGTRLRITADTLTFL